MKSTFLFLCLSFTVFLLSIAGFSFAQNTGDTSLRKKAQDSPGVIKQRTPAASRRDTVIKRPDSVRTKKPDTTRLTKRDTTIIKRDTTAISQTGSSGIANNDTVNNASKTPARTRDSYNSVLQQQPYFNFFGKPVNPLAISRRDNGKDLLFYLLLGLVCYFALVKLIFSKYFSNLFAVVFLVSLKQKQIREQLLQSQLPSLLMNIFFFVCGGIYISFMLQHFQFTHFGFWTLTLYCTVALGMVYLVKFLVLKLMGWVFNISEATDTYIFVVFLVNKLIGILLIPFLILLAFSERLVIQVLITASLTIIGILFAYRYIISYAPVRKEIKVSQFHFFLYLCAFELAPLLLIYKVLLNFLERSS